MTTQALLERPRLTQRLRVNRDTAMTLVVAPAGYGKSTLLGQWQAADERPFVWIALDLHADAVALERDDRRDRRRIGQAGADRSAGVRTADGTAAEPLVGRDPPTR